MSPLLSLIDQFLVIPCDSSTCCGSSSNDFRGSCSRIVIDFLPISVTGQNIDLYYPKIVEHRNPDDFVEYRRRGVTVVDLQSGYGRSFSPFSLMRHVLKSLVVRRYFPELFRLDMRLDDSLDKVKIAAIG